MRATFSLATNYVRRNPEGELEEGTEWHRVVVWGAQAEPVGKYLHKGRQVCVEGHLETNKWTDTDGRDRYTTRVVAKKVTFLGGAFAEGRAAGGGMARAAADRVRG